MPTLTFKVSPREALAIRRRARQEKATLSKFLRDCALGSAPIVTRRKVRMKKHPVSGLPYDASGEGLPMVTHEQVAAALADFP